CSRGGLLCLPDQLHFVNTVLTARLLCCLGPYFFFNGVILYLYYSLDAFLPMDMMMQPRI
ncbi:hypothetical protein, partial [Escherichia coli]|uniref:hypothetical protein n=1 Tax=Escherichia coli TaxID=562 RepID=UPI001BC8AE9E